MLWLFGQIWLWCLISFVLGAVLTWVVVVLPAHRREADAEDHLQQARG
ncbi:MAG: hypothetical protein ACRDTE_29185 [Pseudonocardiaceae bacterium]